jgi:anion-transporting  ArsA/GET3 family ATPase
MTGVPEVTPGGALPAATLVRMPAPRPEPAPDFPGVQLHIVTGKGGTGKSTVSAALALALASRGQTVLLCEVEGRQGIAQLFDVPPLPYEERRVARGTTGAGDVYAMAIDAESALLEYLDMYYRLGRAGKALDRFGVVEFATTIAPGVRDVLLTGKVYEAANRNRRNKGAREYDAIVLDAPPTGRISQFLNVNTELAGLAKVGPIKSQADVVMKLLRSSRTAIHLVTVLEEMPVQETGDGIAELEAAELPVGGVIVNMVRRQDLDAEERARLLEGTVDREALAASLEKAGISADDELVDGLLEEGHDHAERRHLEDTQRALVEQLGVPTYELPLMPGGVDLAGLYELADLLRGEGLG